MLLLDTHVWLWSVAGDVRRIGRRTRQALRRAESRDTIRISPVSLFELTALHTPRTPPTVASRRAVDRLRRWMRLVFGSELSPSIAIHAGCIPREALADPLDRLLVATARRLDATFLTSEARIRHYASATRNVQVQDAGV